MSEISGSVNVSEILATLTDTQKDILNKQALRIIKDDKKSDLVAYMAFVNMCRDELTPVQQSAVRELLNEVKRRRQELLNELIETVEGVIMNG